MVRVLHSAALLQPPSGICTQMDWEQEAANNLQIEWRVRMYCPVNSRGVFNVMHFDSLIDAGDIVNPFRKVFAWFRLRRNYHEWLLAQQSSVDLFLLRYYVHDPFQYWFLIRCKKPVYLVHHTLEIPELALDGGFFGRIRATLDRLIGNPTIANAKGVVGVTQEIVDYEISRSGAKTKFAHVYPNGILFKSNNLIDRRDSEIPEFLFVANFAPWHGLDRLLLAVAKSDAKFILHLVGSVPSSLISLTNDSRIKLHGQLEQKQIAQLSEQCWIGLASFALDRKKMKEACPLKVREYLMLGLPVYGDYQDIFPKNSIYFRYGTDSIAEIIDFAKNTREYIKDEICAEARLFIDKVSILSDFYGKITNDMN